jgi:deoxyribodipyrimidine photo-lyase
LTTPIIVWFRNDLRLADHPALSAAAKSGAAVLPLYILDDATPGRLRMGGASRWWLNGSVAALNADLTKRGGSLCLRQGSAPEVLATLLADTGASAIHVTRGYEPWEMELEKAVARACEAAGAAFRVFGGRLLFEPEAIVTGDGKPYRVFTPFWKACLAAGAPRTPLPQPKRLRFAEAKSDRLEVLKLLATRPDWAQGLRDTWQPGEARALARLGTFIKDRLANYAANRSRVDIDATSRLSPHLHFGEISPNQVWSAIGHAMSANARADRSAESYLREFGWCEFSYHLLHHFPNMPTEPLRPEFADFPGCDDPLRSQSGEEARPATPSSMQPCASFGTQASCRTGRA